MTYHSDSGQFFPKILLFLVCGLGTIVSSHHALAQTPTNIVPDDTLGLEQSIFLEDGNLTGIGGGAVRGDNLFHSFREFNIGEGQGVYFFPAANIQNILTRVTGSNPSEILGTLGTFGGTNPNLYLLNPNGIIFGENASLDVGGSFVATTANAVQLGEDSIFNASSPASSNLLAVNPSALLFNAINSQAEIINRSVARTPALEIFFNGEPFRENTGLQVINNQSLVLAGGNFSIDGGVTVASGGRVELGGLAAPGIIGINQENNTLQLVFPEGVNRGNVSLQQGIIVNYGGDIAINARNLDINSSALLAGIIEGLEIPNGLAGNITLNATDTTTIANNSVVLSGVGVNGMGQGGDIQIDAKSLSLNDTQLLATTVGQGNAGNILLQAENEVVIQNSSILNSVLRTEDGTFGIGNSGELKIQGRSLLFENSTLGSSTAGVGNAGTVVLKAEENIVFNQSTIANAIEVGGVGQGGEINIQANSLTLMNGAAVASGTLGEGNAGKVIIAVNNAVAVNGSSISNGVDVGGIGNGGEIAVQAKSILLEDGALFLAATLGNGDAGRIQLEATDFIIIDGYNLVENPVLESPAGTSGGLVAGTVDTATGRGGEVEISSDRVTISNGAIVTAATASSQNGGNVLITANTLNLVQGGQIITASEGSGDAGIITINANNMTVADFDPTFSERQASLTEDDFIGSEAASGLFANTLEDSTGNGGSINIETINLSLLNTGRISAKTDGTGDAGSLGLNATGRVYVDNGNLNASAVVGKAGNLQVQAGEIELRNNSLMSVTTPSEGGVILSNSNVFLALEDSDVLANTSVGGDIAIIAPVFIADIFANGGLGITGEVPEDFDALRGNGRVDIISRTGNVTAPDFTFLEDALVELSGNFVNPDTVVAGSCLARRNVAQGSFTVTGTGGLPTSPNSDMDGWYGMPGMEVNASISRPQPSLSVQTQDQQQWQLGDAVVEAQGIIKTAEGRQLLSAVPASGMAAKALVCESP
jgi:filamentous hemagglutinin family protein